jgi:cytochrome P450
VRAASEELLRFETPPSYVGRSTSRDVELRGQTVPQGSAILLLLESANRDHRRLPPDGDRFDIHRDVGRHMGFGYGLHACLGAALARLEGRVALDEILKRFPEWEVDWPNTEWASVAALRGLDALPVSSRTVSSMAASTIHDTHLAWRATATPLSRSASLIQRCRTVTPCGGLPLEAVTPSPR